MKRAQERLLEAEEKREWMTLYFQDSERREILAEVKEKHGIEPNEVAAFSFLASKGGRVPLTEEQMRLWEKLAKKKLPATEIYQLIFGGATDTKVFSKVKEDFRKWQTVKSIN